MTLRSKRMAAAAVLAYFAATAGCRQQAADKPAAKPASAAKVEKLPGEADLTRVTLTPEAEKRLGVALGKVERKRVPRTRIFAGELAVPAGRAVTVSAPMGGTVLVGDGDTPQPGSRVKYGQVLFRLLPILAPEARATMATAHVEAQGQVEQARTQLAAAKVQLDRAERLRRDQIGSAGAIVDARAAYDVADAALKAAEARRDALDKTIQGIEGGTLTPLPIEAEAEGVLKNLHVLPGQKVASGAMLFDVERLDKMWVRVPVYVGDVAAISLDKPAAVGPPTASPTDPTRPARPIPAPPSGDPIAATVDLFYEVDNADLGLRPGQRVGVTLPLKGDDEALVVPHEAVLRDFDGGAWVYVAQGDHHYARKRVRLERIVGDMAVLSAGPAVGTQVVTEGAAEIFGTEFGGAK